MFKLLFITTSLFLMIGCNTTSHQATDIQTTATPIHNEPMRAHTDRYTLVDTAPLTEQAYPLKAIAHYAFGRDIASVGDAINEVLKGSGYRWAIQSDEERLFNQLPLPSIVRQIGPISTENALQVLTGNAWVVNVDNINRLVWFTAD